MSTNEKSQTVFEFFLSKQVQAIITASGLLAVIFNLYLVSKLSPLASAIDALNVRANHLDTTVTQYVPRNELATQFESIKEDVKEIKEDIRDIKNILSN